MINCLFCDSTFCTAERVIDHVWFHHLTNLSGRYYSCWCGYSLLIGQDDSCSVAFVSHVMVKGGLLPHYLEWRLGVE